MGLCLSKPVDKASHKIDQRSPEANKPVPEAPQAPVNGVVKQDAIADSTAPEQALPTAAPASPPADAGKFIDLGQVKTLLGKLAGLSSTPTIALSEATELLCKSLDASLVSIIGISEDEQSYFLLAAHGVGAHQLESAVVMTGPEWSAAEALRRRTAFSLSVSDPQSQASTLPRDLQHLALTQPLRSFFLMPIGVDSSISGVLLLAKESPHAFDASWEMMLGLLAMGLVPHIKNEQVSFLCRLMLMLEGSADPLSFMATLLQGTHRFLIKSTNIRMGCRLGILSSDISKALIFECDFPSAKDDLAMAESPASVEEATKSLHITEINLDNTLLLDAVTKGRARFVSDCASYLQSCVRPATDIFISASQMVASIVVLPLIYNGTIIGGMYFTKETCSNFQNFKDLLMGYVNCMVLVMYNKWNGQTEQLWELVQARSLANAASADGAAGASGDANASGSPRSPAAGQGQAQAQNNSGEGTGPNSGAKLYVKRNCTEAMLKVLQHEIRKTHAKSQRYEWIEDLQLHQSIGKGGFGVVYRGTWKGSVAAVKVMYARQHERQAMKDALEMAVLTTISHPNIIQVYSCFTDMVEDAGGVVRTSGSQDVNVKFRRLQPEEERSLATCNIVVMEYCDRGSLRQALKRGVFHKRIGSSSVAVDLCAIVSVLIEVAQAVQHLHVCKLIHSDIKPENVLLKSDLTKAIGFTTKLSDFGLSKMLRDSYYIVNRSGSGTVTHLAPELFQIGSRITTAVDTFSFGIMMWELYTGQRAYSGLARDAIIDRVYKKQARPAFPLGVPQLYADMAKECWDQDPHNRPSFAALLTRLQDMLAVFQSGSYAPAGGVQGGAAAAVADGAAGDAADGDEDGDDDAAMAGAALVGLQQQQQGAEANQR